MKGNGSIGVIIGRFQIDKLHDGHINLINYVKERNNRVIVLIGLAAGQQREEQSLDYLTRSMMINEMFPDVITAPLRDQKLDEEWSKSVDTKVREIMPFGNVTLYGARDSFIPYYSGNFTTISLEGIVDTNGYSGTQRRDEIKHTPRNSEDFRAGVIYHAANSYPAVFPCVDIAIIKKDGDKTLILLGQKPKEKSWRLPGGHVDQTDTSLEMAALREAGEETSHLGIGNPEYVMSTLVNDWRYTKSKNKIMTTLFKVDYIHGKPEASDDLSEVQWFDLSKPVKHRVVEEHLVLIDAIREYLKINMN